MLNSTLLSSANKVIGSTSPAQFFVNAHFISSAEGSTYSFYPPIGIDLVRYNRDYLENWGDEIDLEMTISPKDYALMQDQGQNLLCVLTYTYVTKDGKMVYSPAPVRTQYHVIINDPRDVRKAVPDIQMYTDPTEKIKVRLMEKATYALRHNRINTIFQNATMEKAIYSITQKLGIKKIELVSPDNKAQYDHIDIASYQGVQSVYQYLQSKYGLYEKGATSYITNDVLYIYPPFETAPKYDRTAIFYQVDRGRYSGVNIFHRIEGDNISIVVNSSPVSHDLSIAGSENVGTGFIFTRASRTTDGFTEIDGNSVGYTSQSSLTVSLNSGRTAVEGVNNIHHIRTTDNPYPQMSEIMGHQASVMEVQWMHADPFQLDPGHAIAYYYDYNEKMVKKTGILQHAIYEVQPMAKIGAQQMFGVAGLLTLRLSPNETVVL